MWRAPGLAREFSAFVLHRALAGHHADLTCVDWSPNGMYIVTGSRDTTARVWSRDPIHGFVPVTLSGHRGALVGTYFAAEDVIYTVSSDGGCFVWTWAQRPELTLAITGRVARDLSLASDATMEAAADEDGDSSGNVENGDVEMGDAQAVDDARGASAVRVSGSGREEVVVDQDGDGLAAAAVAQARPSVAALASRRPHAVPAPYSKPTDILAAAALDALRGEWRLTSKQHFRHDGARITSCAVHRSSSALLVVGFSSGIFGLYTMPDGGNVHTLSISQHDVHSVSINATGDWIAFGSRTLGQLLVWEWRSETYILKQQGHAHDVAAVAYSPNGQLMVTGGGDGKVKVWNVSTGFCFVTFGEHTAPVTAVTFMGGRGGHGLAVVSASLDGTVRAYDLVRYRNFRTLSAPVPAQFVSLATDDAGEIACAGTLEPFSIYVWSLQSGRVTDVLSGHEGPIVSLAFSAAAGLLASGSWDRTVRLWDVFRTGTTATETLSHGSDVLAVAFRPDGGEVAAATLDGQIAFWDPKRGIQTGSIDGRRDAAGAATAAASGSRGGSASAVRSGSSSFSALAYTADGEAIIAGGHSKFLCLFAVAPSLLLRKWQISHNRSLGGVVDRPHSRAIGESGPLADLDLDTGDPWKRKRCVAVTRDGACTMRTHRERIHKPYVNTSPKAVLTKRCRA